MVLIISVSPVVYIFLSTFRTPQDLRNPEKVLPIPFSVKTWTYTIFDLGIGRPLLNSLIIAVGGTVLGLIVIVPSSYAFARKKFPGKEILFFITISTLLFPNILLIVPFTEIVAEWGLYNSFLGMWLAIQIVAVPFSLWILRSYFAEFPPSLEEAAMVFGCTEFQAFHKVALRVGLPGVLAVTFLLFLTGWNEFLYSNMILPAQSVKPATVVLYNYTLGGERTYWMSLLVMSVLLMIPPSILYMLAQRYLGTLSGIGGR
jgi:ABC-type glycerol-3-phosphate transport system permease component